MDTDMKGKATPSKQQASQGGRVMRQNREKESVKSMESAKKASKEGSTKGMKY